MKIKSELILPASGLKKTKIAFKYGADACYGGLSKYSLRKAEVNFTEKELGRAIKIAHRSGGRFYVTFNIFPHNKNLGSIQKDVIKISKFKPDAFIISDPGVISLVKKNSKIPIHLSTQANTTNWRSVKFWKDLGVKRIILARELSLKEIKEIHEKVPNLELEVFVHGAMCISYSGRCLLSAFMTGREANLGDCAQPCRWQYKLKVNNFYLEEEKRPGEYFPIEESENGTYILNSKDLRLIQYLPDLIKAGVTGLKVEGRNKSEYYLATIARAYRKALDAINSSEAKKVLPELLEETEKVAHRGYTTGFLFGQAKVGEIYKKRGPQEKYKFLGIVEDSKNCYVKLFARNQIKKGMQIEVLAPQKIYQDKVEKIIIDSEEKDVANPLPTQKRIKLKLSKDYPKDSFLRTKI